MKTIMKGVVKFFVIIAILLLGLFIFWLLINSLMNKSMILAFSWDINIPNPDKVTVIYNYTGRDGEDLEIWQYNQKKAEKIINNEKFKNIGEQNKEFIREKLDKYYEVLEDNNKKLFNDNVDLSLLLKEYNYFTYANEENDKRTWILLVIDCKTNKLYYFTNVY